MNDSDEIVFEIMLSTGKAMVFAYVRSVYENVLDAIRTFKVVCIGDCTIMVRHIVYVREI